MAIGVRASQRSRSSRRDKSLDDYSSFANALLSITVATPGLAHPRAAAGREPDPHAGVGVQPGGGAVGVTALLTPMVDADGRFRVSAIVRISDPADGSRPRAGTEQRPVSGSLTRASFWGAEWAESVQAGAATQPGDIPRL